MIFSINQQVLCTYGGIDYEAKVIEIATDEDDEPTYLVHYQGWAKKYDEWIGKDAISERLKEFSQEELAKAKEELCALKDTKQRGKGKKRKLDKMIADSAASTPKRNADPVNAPSTTIENVKTGRNMKTKNDGESGQTPKKRGLSVEHFFPDGLKNTVVDDYILVKDNTKLYKLPAEFPVQQIIKDFCDEEENEDDENMLMCIRELQDRFDRLLRHRILYKQERMQHLAAIDVEAAEELLPSKVYGYPHLLRFISQLDDIMDPKAKLSVKTFIMQCVKKFTLWLNVNKDVYYNPTDDYMEPSAEYVNDA